MDSYFISTSDDHLLRTNEKFILINCKKKNEKFILINCKKNKKQTSSANKQKICINKLQKKKQKTNTKLRIIVNCIVDLSIDTNFILKFSNCF